MVVTNETFCENAQEHDLIKTCNTHLAPAEFFYSFEISKFLLFAYPMPLREILS